MVIAGRGKAFSAGGDFQYILNRIHDAPSRNSFEMKRFYERFLSIRSLPFPIIAAIHGPCVGAACCFTMACDLRLISKDAKFGVNFAKLGLAPGMGGSFFFQFMTNPQVAARMLLTGDYIGG
eukprot:Sdes_comp20480_c0_seq7m14811